MPPPIQILSFWKANEKLWIPIHEKDKVAADKLIYETFYDYNLDAESVMGRIIYLDQFQRHFQRHLKCADESLIIEKRKEAHALVLQNLDDILSEADEIELVFALMPAKHLGHFEFIFDVIYNKWARPIPDFPTVSRFHNDTYRKAYTFEKIKQDMVCGYVSNSQYDSDEICDFYPEQYKTGYFGKCVPSKQFFECLGSVDQPNPIISLSGGVDSMVMLAMFINLGKHPIAVHIVYGNRAVSDQEYHFISKYCAHLNVPLHTYKIPFLRRSNCDREFYETMTREMRFHVYRAVGSNVFLGHIREDVIENIWTNISKAQHVNNLKKMQVQEQQNGITVMRPMLSIKKEHIYEMSRIMSIPYLKNTTPSWSNRGKFRERFHAETHRQFGSDVDNKLLLLSETLEQQGNLIDQLVFAPIFNSFNNNRICISSIVDLQLGRTYWSRIFEHVFHHCLCKSKPSLKAIDEFMSRLQKTVINKCAQSCIQIKKDLQVLILYENSQWFLEFG
jgi:tRNA(Ile)-lysidine synthetase-like protein